MAKARKTAARKAAAARPRLDPVCLEKVAALRERAAFERHSGTAQDLRLQALELLVGDLVRVL